MSAALLEKAIFEALALAVLVLDEEGEIIRVNVRAEEFFNLSRKKLVGQHWLKLVDDSKLWLLIRTAAVEHTSATLMHHPIAHSRHLHANIHITPLMDEAFPHAVVLTLEGTEFSEEREEEDIQQHINRSAGVMAAMLAHEVNNPLSGIRGAAQLLGEDATEENKPLAELICKEVDRIHGVLDRVELFADSTELPIQNFNIHEAIRHAKQVAEHGFARGITFLEEYDPSLPEVSAGRDAVIHILLNLMKNASEALAEVEAPCITIRTHMLYGAHLRPRDSAIRNCIAVDIHDNGPGIPQEIRHDIFKPFVSLHKGQGRGLGLAICHKLATDMGGRLELVDSKQGACFRLMLGFARG